MSYEPPPSQRDLKALRLPLVLALGLLTGFALAVSLAFGLWGDDEREDAGPGSGGGDTQVEEVAPTMPPQAGTPNP